MEESADYIFTVEESVRHTVEDSTWCGACGTDAGGESKQMGYGLFC